MHHFAICADSKVVEDILLVVEDIRLVDTKPFTNLLSSQRTEW
jgi:hypothetical protein